MNRELTINVLLANSKRATPFLIIFTIAILNILSCGGAGKKTVDSSQTYPRVDYNWYLSTLEEKTVPFSEFKDKVVFLHIWASWCPPCLKEIPGIQQLYNTLNKGEVVFVIASSENKDKIQQFLITNQIHLPVYMIHGPLPQQFRNEYIPRTYIVDRFGKIVYHKIGQADWNTKEIKEFLHFLSNVRVTDQP